MLAVNDLGEPCAGEPHARFDGRELETEHPGYGREEEQQAGKPICFCGFTTYVPELPPRQLPTYTKITSRPSVESKEWCPELRRYGLSKVMSATVREAPFR